MGFIRLALSFPLLLTACVVIPVPDKNQPLEDLTFLKPGNNAALVRDTLGPPNLLDSPRFFIYQWSGGRRLFLVAITPLGLPAGGMTEERRTRVLFEVDEQGKINRVDCSMSSPNADGSTSPPCLVKENSDARFELLKSSSLSDIPGFNYNESRAITLQLDPTGKFLAMVDTQHRVQLIDLNNLKVAYQHQGRSPCFWCIETVQPPQVTFSPDGKRLLISQKNEAPQLLDLLTDEPAGLAATWPDELGVARFAVDGSIVALNKNQGRQLALDGELLDVSGEEGQLSFSVEGFRLKHPGKDSSLKLVEMESAWWMPSPRAFFDSSGNGLAVFQTPMMNPPGSNYPSLINFQFSSEGKLLVSSDCQQVLVWNSQQIVGLLRGEEPHSPRYAMIFPLIPSDRNSLTGCLGQLAMHPSSELLAGSRDARIHVWRIEDAELLATMQLPDPHVGTQIRSLQFTYDNQLMAIIEDGGSLFLAHWQLFLN